MGRRMKSVTPVSTTVSKEELRSSSAMNRMYAVH